MSWLKKSNLAAFLLGILLSLLILEFLLRFYPPDILHDDIYYHYDADVGWLPIPNNKSKFHLSCLYINPIHINKYGFRDKEWIDNGEFTIAILGDSNIQGYYIPEGVHLAAVLEKILGYRVLNSGIDNFGTLHEYLAFKKYILPYKPQIVILSFYANNDVAENSYKVRKRLKIGHELWPSGFIDQQGGISLFYPETIDLEQTTMIRNLLKRYCKTCLLGRRIYDYISVRRTEILYWGTYGGSGRLGYHEIFLPEDADWGEAWKLTDYFLVQLKEIVNSYGGKLFVVTLPEPVLPYMRLSKSWEQEFKQLTNIKEIPTDFNLDRPLINLKKLASKNNIQLFELESFLLKYSDANQLTMPHFSYRCDGHYNPLGHFLFANLVAQYLLENDFIPMDAMKKSKTLEGIKTNLKLDPQTILTAKGYHQIYRQGRFVGQTNILKILATQ